MWAYLGFVEVNIVKGEDIPAQLVPKLHSELGRIVGVMLFMCKPLFSTFKSVAMDSGLCVSNGIFALAVKGVYASALVKKRRYWPKGVSRDLIN